MRYLALGLLLPAVIFSQSAAPSATSQSEAVQKAQQLSKFAEVLRDSIEKSKTLNFLSLLFVMLQK